MTFRILAAVLLILAWAVLTWWMLRRPLGTRPQIAPKDSNAADVAVLYGSQTGTARELAERTAEAFGPRAVLKPMQEASPEELTHYDTALFIVSTYGEGDPPDMAQQFWEAACALRPGTLNALQTGVLALGDSSYRHYCGFGLALSAWLQAQGTASLFDTVAVDKTDASALGKWRDHLSRLFQVRPHLATQYEAWTLRERRMTNPGSVGGLCHALHLSPRQGELPRWRAGDIAEIQIGDSGQLRDYSIASIPSEGVLRLLVREHRRPDGSFGMGSHWLTQTLQPDGQVQLRLRPNPMFYAELDARPSIFIGNGTGIAGLRALLAERVAHGCTENWLFFGERQCRCDFHFGEEIRAWQTEGKLSRLDVAYSRDQAQKRYVHHLLHESAPTLLSWVARGAVVHVCGSRDGMGKDVEAALLEILGPFGFAELKSQNRYRRDVY